MRMGCIVDRPTTEERMNVDDMDLPSPPTASPDCRASEVRRNFSANAFVPQRVNAEISRRYNIQPQEIGQGGFGKVYCAEDREVPGRRVAIKRVAAVDEERKSAFQREAHIMKDLDHPHICRLWETYEQGRTMWFVMELCEGGELFERVIESNGLAEHSASEIVKQVASALRHAHNKGIAHRDLKPENCCFVSADETDNQVKVIDWGVGFYFGRAVMRSGVGSIMYTAPEILDRRGKPNGYTHACDLWSLGVMTYVMLCGKPPFWGSPTQQMTRMMKEQYPLSDKTWASASDESKDFIRGLLRVDDKVRFSIGQVLDHPWLRSSPRVVDPVISQQVLANLRTFKHVSTFFSICAASVARQLDHRQLQTVRTVFSEMDTNGDGVLQLDEMRHGFEKVYGKDSEILQEIEDLFLQLDLDGSGAIDYTEFCAAALDEAVGTQESALRAAFKAFDVVDDDGRLTREEVEKVLATAGASKAWSPDVCTEVTNEIFERFDENGDGTLDFTEWLALIAELRKPTTGDARATIGPTLLGNMVHPVFKDPDSPARSNKDPASPARSNKDPASPARSNKGDPAAAYVGSPVIV